MQKLLDEESRRLRSMVDKVAAAGAKTYRYARKELIT
jgi:hypothetical protein